MIFIGPMLDKDTRSARVVAEIDNQRRRLAARLVRYRRNRGRGTAGPARRAGRAPFRPWTAGRLHSSGHRRGFRNASLCSAKGDDRATEVVSGLRAGETIAVSNTFLLKAEMLKGSTDE